MYTTDSICVLHKRHVKQNSQSATSLLSMTIYQNLCLYNRFYRPGYSQTALHFGNNKKRVGLALTEQLVINSVSVEDDSAEVSSISPRQNDL